MALYMMRHWNNATPCKRDFHAAHVAKQQANANDKNSLNVDNNNNKDGNYSALSYCIMYSSLTTVC